MRLRNRSEDGALGQRETPPDTERRNIVARFVGSLRDVDLRWPQFGRTLPIVPQVIIGAYSIKNVMPAPFGDVASLVFGSATVWGTNAYLDGGWPFHHREQTPPELPAIEPDIAPPNDPHIDS